MMTVEQSIAETDLIQSVQGTSFPVRYRNYFLFKRGQTIQLWRQNSPKVELLV